MYRAKIDCFVDKELLFGREQKIHEVLKFLTNSDRSLKKILMINGSKSQDCSSMARYAVKYAMDRHHFKDGAFYIDAGNKISEYSLMHAIINKFGSLSSDQDLILQSISHLKLLLFIDNCQKLLEKE